MTVRPARIKFSRDSAFADGFPSDSLSRAAAGGFIQANKQESERPSGEGRRAKSAMLLPLFVPPEDLDCRDDRHHGRHNPRAGFSMMSQGGGRDSPGAGRGSPPSFGSRVSGRPIATGLQDSKEMAQARYPAATTENSASGRTLLRHPRKISWPSMVICRAGRRKIVVQQGSEQTGFPPGRNWTDVRKPFDLG